MGYMIRPAAWAVSGLVLAGVAFAAPTASHAAVLALSNTGVTGGTLDGWLGAPRTGVIQGGFDFLPSNPGGDGWIRSQVFEGAGAAAGQFVYLYQLRHFPDSSEASIGGFSFDWGSEAPASVGGVTSLYTTGASGTAVGFVQPPTATVPSNSSQYDGNAAKFLFESANSVLKGDTSLILGLFSPFAPISVVANVLDTDEEVRGPVVYAPVPVPAALPLFLSALAGIGFFSRKRA
jgi:hypothetical protein